MLKVGDRVPAKLGSAAADAAGYGLWIGTVQAISTAPADGIAHVVVLMDEQRSALRSTVVRPHRGRSTFRSVQRR